jgi:hypothetical protein
MKLNKMKISEILLFLIIQISICNRLIAQSSSICCFKYEKKNIIFKSDTRFPIKYNACYSPMVFILLRVKTQSFVPNFNSK